MKFEDLKLKNVLYYMQSFIINVAGIEFDVPRTMIGTFQVSKLFEEMIYPLYYVSLELPLWLYEEITKHPDDIYINLNLQYALARDPDTIQVGDAQLRDDIKGRFRAIIPFTSQIGDASHQLSISQMSGSYKKSYEYGEESSVELALYNEAYYNASFDTINKEFMNINLMDALTWVFNRGGMNKILIEPPDNWRTYGDFHILPQSTMKNILRIVDEFKFHNDGSVAFFDLMRGYIISKRIGCRAWVNNEHKAIQMISMAKFSEAIETYGGIHIDDDKKLTVIAVPEDAFKTQRPDSSPLLKNDSAMDFLTIQTRNAVLGMMTPNKEYIFTVDDNIANKYNGKYRLYSLEMDCNPRGEFLDPVFTMTFRK